MIQTLNIQELIEKTIADRVNYELGEKLGHLRWLRNDRNRISHDLSLALAKIRKHENDAGKQQLIHEQAARRQLFGRFTVGDTVYITHRERVDKRVCQTCKNENKISVSFDSPFGQRWLKVTCPDCDGNDWNKMIYKHHVRTDKVSQITCKLWRGGRELEVWLEREDGSRRDEAIFMTLEEAQAYCDEKNAAEEAKKTVLA
jgi:hypothetical protein